MDPITEPLPLPDGYGEATRILPWARVRERLERSVHYWVATTRPDGRPHVVPRWGVWLDDVWYYDGSPETRHARNIEGNPAAALHLESGIEVVIVEGESHPVTPAGDLGVRLAQAFVKYHDLGYAPEATDWDGGGLSGLRPRVALAWTRYPEDATRFRFE